MWDGTAPWWCSWCNRPPDPYGAGSAVPVTGVSNAGALTQGLYRIRLSGREVEGLLVAGAPDGDVPLGFVTCGPECAEALMLFGRETGTVGAVEPEDIELHGDHAEEDNA